MIQYELQLLRSAELRRRAADARLARAVRGRRRRPRREATARERTDGRQAPSDSSSDTGSPDRHRLSRAA
ncbi:hypothetical protein [Streptomyces sp. NPDC006012]|uniref:hypothetical protein n=1 Tax=Streptomyces sp. NPDC006012 TaxID=3364739 RepID=UPI00369FAFB5